MITPRPKRCNKQFRQARRDFLKGYEVGLEMRHQQKGEFRPQVGPWADGAKAGLEVRDVRVQRDKRRRQADEDFSTGRIGRDERNAVYGTV